MRFTCFVEHLRVLSSKQLLPKRANHLRALHNEALQREATLVKLGEPLLTVAADVRWFMITNVRMQVCRSRVGGVYICTDQTFNVRR
jgi:hypothetical protein